MYIIEIHIQAWLFELLKSKFCGAYLIIQLQQQQQQCEKLT